MAERLLFSGLRDKYTADPNQKMGVGMYIIAALSFIPVLGMVFGLVTILLGLCLKRKGRFKIIAIGFAGILFTLGLNLYFSNYAFKDSDGNVYVRKKLTETALEGVLENIETYKAQFGSYPESLDELAKLKTNKIDSFIHDPMDVAGGLQPRHLYYKKVDANHYYLRSSGTDGVPFTNDDVTPEVKTFSQKQSGILIQLRN